MIDQILAEEDQTATFGTANRVLWDLADNQGTIRDLVKYDSSTNAVTVVNHIAYDPWGKETSVVDANGSATTLKTRYGYTGRELDSDTGLQYNRRRWYDAAVGRWISEDPIGFAGGDTNVNRYVRNSPTNHNDASGLRPPGVRYNHVGLQKTPITQAEIDAGVKEWCTWLGITVTVYKADYFHDAYRGDLDRVGNFYKRYGILIDWDIWEIQNHRDKQRGSQGAEVDPQPYEQYLNVLDIWADPDSLTYKKDLSSEPDLQWYADNFARTPTLFLIGAFDIPGIIPGADLYGYTRDPFMWVADTAFGPSYDKVIAHEMGHLLGYYRHDTFGIMAGDFPNMERGFQSTSTVEQVIRKSRYLTPISPVPRGID